MRVNELNAQIEAVELALKKLQSDALSQGLVIFPIEHAPAPDIALTQRWLIDAGLPDDLELRCRPGRYLAATPLLSVPNFTGDLPDGWELVEARINSPLTDRSSETAWANPMFTQKYRQWLEKRQQS